MDKCLSIMQRVYIIYHYSHCQCIPSWKKTDLLTRFVYLWQVNKLFWDKEFFCLTCLITWKRLKKTVIQKTGGMASGKGEHELHSPSCPKCTHLESVYSMKNPLFGLVSGTFGEQQLNYESSFVFQCLHTYPQPTTLSKSVCLALRNSV